MRKPLLPSPRTKSLSPALKLKGKPASGWRTPGCWVNPLPSFITKKDDPNPIDQQIRSFQAFYLLDESIKFRLYMNEHRSEATVCTPGALQAHNALNGLKNVFFISQG
jgi:hypothetical protein